METVAHSYVYGYGNPYDDQRALFWLGASVGRYSEWAPCYFAQFLKNDHPKEAEDVLSRAVHDGNVPAAYELGVMRFENREQRDNGLELINMAAEKGNHQAKVWLERNAARIFDRFVCLDISTTGDNVKVDKICEIGAVEFDPITFEKKSQYRVYINPRKPMPIKARLRHGLNDKFLSGHSIFEDEADDFLTYIRDATVFLFNKDFVGLMLNEALVRTEKDQFDLRTLGDVTKQVISIREVGEEAGYSAKDLDELCAQLKVDTSDRGRHGALVDAKLMLQLLAAMKNIGVQIPGLP